MALTALEKEVAIVTARARKPWPSANLYEMRLPAGNVDGFSIDFQGDHLRRLSSSEWLSQGYQGIRIIGAGKGVTHLRAGPGYHDSTIFVGPHNGIVALESLSIHPAARKAVHMGLERAPLHPNFALWAKDVALETEAPAPGGARAVWGFFTYQCDQLYEDVEFFGADLNEHTSYGHGFSKRGGRYIRCHWHGSGAEQIKWANRPWEVQFVQGATIYGAECVHKNWNQPHSWRGGAGWCIQGGGADVVAERCTFWGGNDSSHCRCFMVDDGGSDHYGTNGAPGGHPANGWVVVRESGMTGAGTEGSSNPVVRVGPLSQTSGLTARGLFMDSCGIYGHILHIQTSNITSGKTLIRRCNTPDIQEIAAATGFNTAYQAGIPLQHRVAPLSEGLSR